MSIFSKITAAVISAAIAVSILSVPAFAKEVPFENASEAIQNIGAGWNLGNSLDSCGEWIALYTDNKPADYEKAWGNPVTTKKLISSVKAAGFNAVRFPVTWTDHTDQNGNIDKEWLDRVQEIVDWIIAEDMYCILNVHHDGGSDGWIEASSAGYKANSARFKGLWKNIAARFKNYDEKLMFESFNEVLDKNNNWISSDSEGFEAINKYNQLFVDTVRKTGGRNDERTLVVQTYAANGSTDAVLKNFVLPKDTVKNHLMVQVHCYDPQGFTTKDATWTKMTDEWGSSSDKSAIDSYFKKLSGYADKWGAPVIVGEFGSQDKSNEAERAEHAGYYVSTAGKYGIKCFWWDNGAENEYKIIDRNSGKKVCSKIVNALVKNAEKSTKASSDKLPAATLKGKLKDGKLTLTWNKIDGAYGYRVYKYDAKSGKYKQIAFIKSNKKTVTGLSKGSYKFKVVAVEQKNGKNKNGESSNALKVTIK